MPAVDFSHRYAPLWDAQREAVTSWRCVSRCDSTAPDRPDLPPRQKLAFAQSRIVEAGARLARHLQDGERFIVWLPLPYDLLASAAGRMEIAGACRQLAAGLRPYLVFEICDLPPGVPQSRLSELVCALKPFGRGVAALLPGRAPSYSPYLGAGLMAIGLSFPSVEGTDISGEIFRLAAAARKQKMTSFLLNVPNGQALQDARALGINLLSNPRIGQPLKDPQPVRRLSAQHLASAPAVPKVGRSPYLQQQSA
jgi:hypothetical protein